jgi:hypothetical protein
VHVLDCVQDLGSRKNLEKKQKNQYVRFSAALVVNRNLLFCRPLRMKKQVLRKIECVNDKIFVKFGELFVSQILFCKYFSPTLMPFTQTFLFEGNDR